MDQNDTASQLKAAMKEDRNIRLFDLYAEPLFARQKPNVRQEFTLFYVKQWKDFPDLEDWGPDRAIEFVQQVAEKYAELKGLEVLHRWNNDVVLPITNYIIRKRLGFKTVRALKSEDPKMYSTIQGMVGEFLWESKPLRGYYEMPAPVEYIANTVFNRKIKAKLSKEDLEKFGLESKDRTCHVRNSNYPLDDAEVQAYILDLLQSRPMDKFSHYEIAACVRIGEGQASDNLKWLAGQGKSIIAVKPRRKHGRMDYKWCPEAHLIEAKPERKMEYVSQVLYRLLNQHPGTTATGARMLLRRYFGNTDSNVADKAVQILKESGLVVMQPDSSHKQRLHCVVQEKTDERRKMLARLAKTMK